MFPLRFALKPQIEGVRCDHAVDRQQLWIAGRHGSNWLKPNKTCTTAIYIYMHIRIVRINIEHFHTHNGKNPSNLEPCHSTVSKIFYLVRFHIFEPCQSSKLTLNNWKAMKNNEKKWTPMKKIWKYNKNDETYGKKSTQWKASIYIDIIWSNVTPGSRKYSILSVFVFLSLIKAQRITLNNWKALKKQWNMMKKRKNRETWWTDRKKQEK